MVVVDILGTFLVVVAIFLLGSGNIIFPFFGILAIKKGFMDW